MRSLHVFVPLALLLLAACGTEIGDECRQSRDCSPDGDRACDVSSPGGYCTVVGCDSGSCPSEAVCVRFFSAETDNVACEPHASGHGDSDCTADEVCTLGGHCLPQGAQTRFCMRACSDDGDCRDAYECRDRDLMVSHGGEPIPPPDGVHPEDPQGFCAPRPPGA